ncbi:MAG TPA: DUF4142 domain-containing protein [Bacteroidales bacterium]|nr:DUF4142 domain-containing protein [Bacteroidales bacterium]
MKNLKSLFLLIIPVIMLACNDGTNQNRNKNHNDMNDKSRDNNMNRNKSGSDTISKGSFMIRFIILQQDNDREFVMEAASGGLMEVELGRIASESAINPRVKKFGEMMVRDHTKANEELKAIASAKNFDVPSEMTQQHQRIVDEIRDEKGEGFDKAYIKNMVTAHDKVINLFQKQSDDGNDASLKAFASKTLPVLMMHRDSVKAIQKDMK